MESFLFYLNRDAMETRNNRPLNITCLMVASIVLPAMFWFVYSLFGAVPSSETVVNPLIQRYVNLPFSRWFDVVGVPLLTLLIVMYTWHRQTPSSNFGSCQAQGAWKMPAFVTANFGLHLLTRDYNTNRVGDGFFVCMIGAGILAILNGGINGWIAVDAKWGLKSLWPTTWPSQLLYGLGFAIVAGPLIGFLPSTLLGALISCAALASYSVGMVIGGLVAMPKRMKEHIQKSRGTAKQS